MTDQHDPLCYCEDIFNS